MSCLFRALAYFTKDDAFILRQKICNFLSLNRPMNMADPQAYIEWESGLKPATYIGRMRGNAWGGGIEIAAFCELYQTRVLCYNYRDRGKDIEFLPGNKVHLRTIRIRWEGGHYEPVDEPVKGPDFMSSQTPVKKKGRLELALEHVKAEQKALAEQR